MLRSVLAVAAGYLLLMAVTLAFSSAAGFVFTLALRGRGDALLAVVHLACAGLGGVAGGLATARIAGRAPVAHAAALAALLLTVAVVSVARPAPGIEPPPAWYLLTTGVVAGAGALLGGRVRRDQLVAGVDGVA